MRIACEFLRARALHGLGAFAQVFAILMSGGAAAAFRRKRSAQDAVADGEHRSAKLSNVLGKCVSACGNRTWLVNTLQTLQAAGALEMQDSERSLRNQVQRSVLDHGRAITPYGRVVQTLDLGEDKCVHGWEYINPFV